MEVVLLENIKNLGQIGDVVKIKRGYGRNFLIKFGKALKSSKDNINFVNIKKVELNQKNVEQKRNAKKVYDIINLKTYKFSKRAKENNELFGSIKPKELTLAIKETNDIEIKPSQIDLNKEINEIGQYEAQINLHADIQAKIHIQVVKIEDNK